MMNKRGTKEIGRTKYLMSLPLAATYDCQQYRNRGTDFRDKGCPTPNGSIEELPPQY